MAEKEKKPNRIARWWRETIGEMRKVSWPTPKDALRLTRIVVTVMLGMSLVLGVLDFVFSKLITLLFA
jgi:preprotein translocase subunit SecE